jgi:hypothetical protein
MILKALLVGVAMTLAPSVNAQTVINKGSYGAWTWIQGTTLKKDRICALSSFTPDRSFHVKHFAGTNHLLIQIMKDSWNIPNGTNMKVGIKFGAGSPWVSSKAEGNGDVVELAIGLPNAKDNAAAINLFLNEMAQASAMRVAFPDGSEPVWDFTLAGSSKAISSFAQCIISWTTAEPTQPQSKGPTQPFSPQSKPASTAPTQPNGVRI